MGIGDNIWPEDRLCTQDGQLDIQKSQCEFRNMHDVRVFHLTTMYYYVPPITYPFRRLKWFLKVY